MSFVAGVIIGAVGAFVVFEILLRVATMLGLYCIVPEGQCKVFVLFGKILGVLPEAGLFFPISRFGLRAVLLPFFGKMYSIDTRLDQEYLRSQPVNSEEGTPMGVGTWVEMRVSNPVDYLFKNNDPRGSLRANVSSATVRCLSNMPLEELLTSRHKMSRIVREEVSPKSDDWGFTLGSIYIRKVHFRDETMIRQIEQKVGNRLLQVTSAIRQAGANQVDVIKSEADKRAAVEFARAASMRPQIVGSALEEISRSPEVLYALMENLEIQRLVKSESELILVPAGSGSNLLTALQTKEA